ncbi:universal stress protein [Nitrincola sp. MINF-07-Sa-05]|uniref:universal stress protein n=1 Tax=Nitrincola salilacus TaxID=3400273 RepID=UPI003917C2DC
MKQVIASIDSYNHMAETVVDYAAWASQQLDAPLVLLHVLEKGDLPVNSNLTGNIGLGSREALLEELTELDEKRAKLMREQGRMALEDALKRATDRGITDAATLQRHDDLVETLHELESDLRLLVMGREGSKESSAPNHIGTHLESVIRTLHRPILIASGDFKKPERFMIAYDASPTAKKLIDMLAGSPLLKDIPCHLLMIDADTDTSREQLKEARIKLEAKGFTVTEEVAAGEVEPVINERVTSLGIDLLVMGAYGHSRIRQFLVGSTTTKLLKSAQVPLLLLR